MKPKTKTSEPQLCHHTDVRLKPQRRLQGRKLKALDRLQQTPFYILQFYSADSSAWLVLIEAVQSYLAP